uniref:FoxQ2-1 n=1 Tax=Schizocardium californicum TaxID=1443244 RepID=A0A1X9PSP3_9BILA|nr:foxQ2-1 [Schizocardium californicum]
MTLFSVEALTSTQTRGTHTNPISPGSLSTTSSETSLGSTDIGSPSSLSGRSSPNDKKPNDSYIALIAKAILSNRERKLLLCDIYQYIMDNHPFYRNNDKSWRNSIRHNLSLNECFIKNGRSSDGRGNFWSIHPANLEDFVKGDFRRRKARRRVRQCYDLVSSMYRYQPHPYVTYGPSSYVPMTASSLPYSYLSHPGFNPAFTTPAPYPQHYTASATTLPIPTSPESVARTAYHSQPIAMTSQPAPTMMSSAPVSTTSMYATWQDTFTKLQAMK